MYVIQSGEVEIVREINDQEVLLAVRGEGEVFGEMAIFERHRRMATVRAKGPVRVLTVDKKSLLRSNG
jgi:CRP-like cAMP-binding protein